MNIPYFSFYPQEWLADPKVAQLNYEEKGVYFDLLCRMWTYADGSCSLPSDDQFLCRMLRMRPAKWAKIKGILIEGIAPVFTVQEGRLLNKRLSKEFVVAKEKSKKNFASAKKRWGDKSSNSLKTKETADANALPTECHKDKDKDKDINPPITPPLSGGGQSKGEDEVSPKPKKKKIKKPQTFMTEDFKVSEDVAVYAKKHNTVSPYEQLQQFINHYMGTGEARADWNASFKNWLIRSKNYQGDKNGKPRNQMQQVQKWINESRERDAGEPYSNPLLEWQPDSEPELETEHEGD